jgi:predicted transcriptional regulator
MSPATRSDIIISIKPNHMQNIALRLKTHEFRNYFIPPSVKRMWFYTTAPEQRIRYVAVVGTGKRPGKISLEDTGLGNEDFNAGKKESKYGYEILHLYELREPLSLQDLIARRYAKSAPRKYCWVSDEMLNAIEIEKQKKLF